MKEFKYVFTKDFIIVKREVIKAKCQKYSRSFITKVTINKMQRKEMSKVINSKLCPTGQCHLTLIKNLRSMQDSSHRY